MSVRALAVALSALAGRAAAGVAQQDFRLAGACGARGFLNGLVFQWRGRTQAGAPFYQAVSAEAYIYYDPDCGASTDGQGRWILDSDRPSVTAKEDLDQDHACRYHARVNCPYSQRLQGPPPAAVWYMDCGGAGWQNRSVTLAEVTTTSTGAGAAAEADGNSSTTTETTTTATATTATRTTATTSTTAPPPALELHMHGACPAMESLDGLVLHVAGRTAGGAPYYAGSGPAGAHLFLYHDPSCDGFKTRPAPRWILDTDAPDLERASDLDQDHKCDYLAAVDSKESARPPASSAWHVRCGDRWKIVALTLAAPGLEPARTRTTTSTPVPHGFMLSGARARCPAAGSLLAALAGALAWSWHATQG